MTYSTNFFYLLSIFVAVVLFVAGCEDEVNTEVISSDNTNTRILFADDFKDVVYQKNLSAYNLDHLKRNKVSQEKVTAMPQPAGWVTQFWSVCPDTTFYLNSQKEFAVKSKSRTFWYSNELFRASNKAYQIVLDVECPASSEVKKSVVGTGFCLYDLYENRISFRDVECFSLSPGQRKTFTVSASFTKWNSQFRLGFYAQGEVIIKKIELREIQSEIVPDMIDLTEGTLVIGRVKARSVLPDPKKSDYPDCRFTVHFEGINILDGKPCPSELQLVVDGFLNYKLLKSDDLKVGDIIQCFICPFSNLPQKRQSTQVADDLELFMLDSYAVLSVEKVSSSIIKEFSPIPFTDSSYKSIFEQDFNPPLSEQAHLQQQKAIAADLKYINERLAPYATEQKRSALKKQFSDVWNKEKEKDGPKFNRFLWENKKYVWRNIDNSYWALPESWELYSELNPIDDINLQSLLELQRFLNKNGIQLIVCPTPGHFDIAARVMNPEFRNVPDFRTAYLVQQLLKNGIETIYSSDEIVKYYNRYPLAFFIHDFHPADTAQDVITNLLIEKLKRYNIPATMEQKHFSVKLHPHVFSEWGREGYSFPSNCDIGKYKAGSDFLCRKILYKEKDVAFDKNSPVLLIGNSMLRTPMKAPESFPTLCSLKLSAGVDVLMGYGWSTHTRTLNSLVNAPELYLKDKKVVVLVANVSHFYGKVKFYNVSELDKLKIEMSNRSLRSNLQANSNCSELFPFLKKGPPSFPLKNPKCIKMPENGEYTILDTKLSKCSPDKEIILLFRLQSGKSSNTTFMRLNAGDKIPILLDGVESKRILLKLPAGSDRLKLDFISKDINEIAFDDIQVFQ